MKQKHGFRFQKHIASFAFVALLFLSFAANAAVDPVPGRSTAMSDGVVNWNQPSKKDLVERAMSDGMTNSADIAKWANNYKVTMTAQEVDQIKEGLKK